MATAFETEMGVLPELSKAVQEMDWILPTDIQSEAVPLILGGGDVLMAAETGSGKTGAFCLPVLQIVYETLKILQSNKHNKANILSKHSSDQIKLNVYDRTDAMAIDNDGLLCQSRDPGGWHGARANLGVKNEGRYYYEAHVTDEGLCRVGWSTLTASHDIGTDAESFGFGGTGKMSHRRQFDSYGEAFGKGDTIGCFLDLDKRCISWSKNATLSGTVTKPRPNAPLALIIEPSRELAEQTYEQIKKFKRYLKDPCPRECLLIGGANSKQQMDELHSGVDIVVATPGRLDDLISTQSLLLSNCRFFVLDECDGLLSAGYGDMVSRIHKQIPKATADGNRLQMIVCSATLHSVDVKRLANKLMHFPVWIDLKGQDSVPETVHHVVCLVDPITDTSWKELMKSNNHIHTDGVHMKDQLNPNSNTPELLSEAVKLIKGEYVIRAIKQQNMDRALIFCRTKLDCDNLEQYFISIGGGPNCRTSPFSCVCLHSDRSPPERKANLQKFKNGDVRFLICTDVAARGIDIAGLPYVINVTLPDEKQNYVHRIGRVGRAERMGLAISLVSTVKEKVWYHSNCSTRGRGCYNTRLLDQGGCCMWYNEVNLLSEIEEHLGVTIDVIDKNLTVPVNAFDGKVVYGQKLKQTTPKYTSHVDILSSSVKELDNLEKRSQQDFLRLRFGGELAI
ncbi:ATP-dependent RNA helicase DDX1 [Schistosoma japonicum]|nr:ATP-dependent RNA helicase DDX1 [Schistosoma japonicum]